MPSCTVRFDSKNSNGVFNSGDEVSGSVTLFNEKPRRIRSLLLKVEGYAETSWSSGSGNDERSENYSAHEDYIQTVRCLFRNGSGASNREHPFQEQELPAGQHTYKFCFVLPSTIPSSFSHLYGNILYQIKVEMERRLKFNYSFTFPFTVSTCLDLNYEGDELRRPLRRETSKKFFLSSNALVITAEIPFCGFTAGQTLTITANVINKSSVKVDQISFELRQLCHFKNDEFGSTRDDHQILLQGNQDGVEKKSIRQVTFSMEIPHVEPTSVRFCKYILISYELSVIAKVGGFHRSSILKMPITIGTVPLSGLEISLASKHLLKT